MLRLISSILLIAGAVAMFILFTNPLLDDISTLRSEVGVYNEALGNSKALENERDKLTKIYNSIVPEDLIKLEKLLPENVDNIRLILEIEKIATPHGMVLTDVRYDTFNKKKEEALVQGAGAGAIQQNKGYGVWDLEFSTSATYDNFLNFLKDLEKNLRIVDISSIQFASDLGIGANPNLKEVYKYSFKIKTYWLKN